MDLRSFVIGKRHERLFTIAREGVDQEKRTVPISFTSEAPVVRWWGIEILSHSPGAVRLERAKGGLPFLMDHDPRDQRGRLENVSLGDDRRTHGDVRFSKRFEGEELFLDISDGIRPDVSCGYIIHDARELKPEEMSEEIKSMALREQLPVYLATDWEPLEASSVSIPADVSVGVGRSRNYLDGMKEEDIRSILEKKNNDTETTQRSQPQVSLNPTGGKPVDTPKTQDEILKAERERVAEIEAIAARFAGRVPNIGELKAKAVNDGTEAVLFKGMVADRITDGKHIEQPASAIGLSEKQAKSFSITRALNFMLTGKGNAEFEMEASKAVATAEGRELQPGELNIPWEALTIPRMMKRDVTVSGTSSAFVGTDLQPQSFIELARNRSVADKVGVKFLTGLRGNIAFPKQTGAATFGWVGEAGTASESTQTYGQVTLSPKEGGTYTEVSFMLINQGTPDAEALIIDDLNQVTVLALDAAVFHGSAASNQPRGIANESGIGSITGNGASIGWDGIVDLLMAPAGSNLDADRMYWVTRPAVAAVLMKKQKAVNTAEYLMDADGRVATRPSVLSNQISAAHLFFGDFSHEVAGLWGGISLLVNPYIKDIDGLVRVNVRVNFDCRLRQAGAIALASAVS